MIGSFVYDGLKLLLPVLSMMPVNAKTRPTWSVSGEVRLAGLNDCKPSSSQSSPNASDSIIDAKVEKKFVPSMFFQDSDLKKSNLGNAVQDQWYSFPDVDGLSLPEASPNVAHDALALWRIRRALAQSTFETRNSRADKPPDPQFTGQSQANVTRPDKANDAASDATSSKNVDLSSQSGKSYDTELPYNSVVQQFKTNTKIPVNAQTLKFPPPYVFRVSANISPVSSKSNSNRKNETAAPSPSDIKNIYLTVKNPAVVPKSYNKYVQTDSLPNTTRHCRLITSSPILPTTKAKSLSCATSVKSDGESSEKSAPQANRNAFQACDQMLNSGIFTASESADLPWLVRGDSINSSDIEETSFNNLSKCKSNCCLDVCNNAELKKKRLQDMSLQECPPSSLQIHTKCQVTQTSKPNVSCRALDEVKRVTQVTQTEARYLENTFQNEFQKPETHNLLSFYLAFRFAYSLLNEKNQESILCDGTMQGTRHNSVDQYFTKWPHSQQTEAVLNKCEAILQSMVKSHNVQQLKKRHNSNSKHPRCTSMAPESHDSRLWYNRSYRKQSCTPKLNVGNKQCKDDEDFILRRTRTYRRRKPTDYAASNESKRLPQLFQCAPKDTRLSSSSSSEDDHIASRNISRNCTCSPGQTIRCKLEASEHCNERTAHPHGKNLGKGCITKRSHFKSSRPTSESIKQSPKQPVEEMEGIGNKLVHKTLKSWAASCDTLMKFLCGEEFAGGCQHHVSSAAIRKLLFRKHQSLSSGTLHESKFSPSSSLTSPMNTEALIPAAALSSFLRDKDLSHPQHLCDATLTMSQTNASVNKSHNDIPLLLQADHIGMNTTITTGEQQREVHYPDQIMYKGSLSTNFKTMESNVVTRNYTESLPCFIDSQALTNYISTPFEGNDCNVPSPTDVEIPLNQSEYIVERFPVMDCSSPDRITQFHSDSVVKSGNYFPPSYLSERWPTLSESHLEDRLSGGSDQGTPSRTDAAEEPVSEKSDFLTDNPNLGCDPSGADQTIVYTCNECCKSCASTTGWSCQTNNYGSGIFIPTVGSNCVPNSIQTWEVFPESTRHCTSTYKAEGKCEIPEIEEEEVARTVPQKPFSWINYDPFVKNESNCHKIPASYDYSYGPNSYYNTGRTSLSAGGQPRKPTATIGCNINNCGQWWFVPPRQNAYNMNPCYEQESTCGWPTVGGWQGWTRNADWWSQERMPLGPEQTWTSPQNVFTPNETRRKVSPESKDDKPAKRRFLIQPSVRKPHLRPSSVATVRDCGSQVNTLQFEDNETPVSLCDSSLQPDRSCSPDCYRYCFEPGVVFDCSTQTNISKIEKQTGCTSVVHYKVREPTSPPLYESNNFQPPPVQNTSCPPPAYYVTSPPPLQTTSCPSPVRNVRFQSPEPNRSCPSPVHNVRFPSPEQNEFYCTPGEIVELNSSEKNGTVRSLECTSPIESLHHSSAPNTHTATFERNEPRAFSSSPCPAPAVSEQLPPCTTAHQQSEELPSEGHSCPQEGKSGLVSDVMKSVQGFRNCLNCGTNQNVHYNRKGVYAVRVISNGKESQNKTNQCVHYKWLPSLPWPEQTCEQPCDSEVYYDSRTCRTSNEEPVEENQECVSWKKEFRRRKAVNLKQESDKRAAGGGGGGKRCLPQEELLSVHSNSHQWGSSYGQLFDVNNCLQKDLKRRHGPPIGVPALSEHDLCCCEVDDENEANSTEWTEDCDGEDIYSYYHVYNNRNEADCELVEEHDEICETNRINDLPTRVATCSPSKVEDQRAEECNEKHIFPAEQYVMIERIHQKTPTKKVQFMDLYCKTPVEEDRYAEDTAEQMSRIPEYTVPIYTQQNNPPKKVFFEEHCCKATQIPSPTYEKCQQVACQTVATSPQNLGKTCSENQPNANITDICITGPSNAIVHCNRCGGPCRPTLLRRNCTCRVKSVFCSCSDNQPPNIDCSVECGCIDNPSSHNDTHNNSCCGYHYCYPNYINCGCYCCPLMHYHSMACYVVPPNYGQPVFEIQNPVQRHTPTPAKFKESYKPEDWTPPPPPETPDPEEEPKTEAIKPLARPDENTTFALRCKHRRMNESPSGKITLHDCEVSEDSRRFIPGENCAAGGQKTECSGANSKKPHKCTANASTSGSPLLEVLAQNEEVIRAAKDCLKRTVNYISMAKGETSGDDLCVRKKNSPRSLLPEYWAMKTGLYQRCQLIDKISDECINVDLVDPPSQPCFFDSMNINENNVDSLLLLDPDCDEPEEPCDVTEAQDLKREGEKECSEK